MQRVRLHDVLAVGAGRNRQLLVAVIQILLREVEARQLQHLAANGGSSAVGADHNVRRDRRLCACLFIPQLDGSASQIEAGATLIEVDGHAVLLGGVHQRDIQVGTRDGVDDLSLILAVWHERELAGDRVHHAPAHRDDDRFD